MSIGMNGTCISCRVNRIINTIGKHLTDAQLTALLKAWMEMASGYEPWVDSARCGYYTDELVKKMFSIDPAELMRKDREASNAFVVSRLEEIRRRVEGAEDPVYAGLQFSVLGNYLDFAALEDTVSYAALDEMLNQAKDMTLDKSVVAQFARDLQKGKKLLILTDNAGEIGFDRVLAEVMAEQYPDLKITFCVRGGPALNDATRADAAAVGIPFPVIDNGNSVPGTDLKQMGSQAKAAFQKADVIFAKGQANVETLLGCGYPIFYAFLIKCPRFIDRFQKPKLTPMLVAEAQS